MGLAMTGYTFFFKQKVVRLRLYSRKQGRNCFKGEILAILWWYQELSAQIGGLFRMSLRKLNGLILYLLSPGKPS